MTDVNLQSLSDTELHALRIALNDELKRRTPSAVMRVAHEFASWKRYEKKDKPFLGVVKEWPIASSPKLRFGEFIGDSSGGECEINASPGDLIYFGQNYQKEFGERSKKEGFRRWAIVQNDGTLRIVDAIEARKHFSAQNPSSD